MKQLLTILLLIVTSSTAFATPGVKISAPVMPAMKRTITEARDMKWVGGDEIVKIQFSSNNQYVTGFYNSDGKLLGLAKNILSTELPSLLCKNLKEKYSQYWISGVLEYSGDEGTVYYTMLENADQKIVLQSFGNKWSVVKKTDK